MDAPSPHERLEYSGMKFSIVTPAYNSAAYIAETIESVLSQRGDFEIEYFIVDGASKDGTVAIAYEYKARLESGGYPISSKGINMSIISEPDAGMYDAINKGFKDATGDVYAWINSDDYYLPGAFASIAMAFKRFPEIRWIKGASTLLVNNVQKFMPAFIYNQSWIRRGIYGRYAYFIQQESVFWRNSLWNEAGPLASIYRYAGDYALWITFSNQAKLWSIDARVSCFRIRPGQLSTQGNHYSTEQNRVSLPQGDLLEFRIKLFFWIKNRFSFAEPAFIFMYPFLFSETAQEYIHFPPTG